MVTKVLTNYARVLMFLEDLVSLPEDCGQNSVFLLLCFLRLEMESFIFYNIAIQISPPTPP